MWGDVVGVWRVAGTRVIGAVMLRANVGGGSIVTVIRDLVRRVGGSLRGRRPVCLENFKDFVLGRETRGATHGVDGGAAVVVPTRGVPTFGPTGRFMGRIDGLGRWGGPPTK